VGITTEIRVNPDGQGRRLVHHHTYLVPLRLRITCAPVGGRPRSIDINGLHLRAVP
jgi:hypothetical protein